ncbi:unnamed protein product, partial [Ascophyllum nodosum]
MVMGATLAADLFPHDSAPNLSDRCRLSSVVPAHLSLAPGPRQMSSGPSRQPGRDRTGNKHTPAEKPPRRGLHSYEGQKSTSYDGIPTKRARSLGTEPFKKIATFAIDGKGVMRRHSPFTQGRIRP